CSVSICTAVQHASGPASAAAARRRQAAYRFCPGAHGQAAALMGPFRHGGGLVTRWSTLPDVRLRLRRREPARAAASRADERLDLEGGLLAPPARGDVSAVRCAHAPSRTLARRDARARAYRDVFTAILEGACARRAVPRPPIGRVFAARDHLSAA